MTTSLQQRLRRIARHDFARRVPAAEWIDGLPLGNGDIGAMSWGGPSHRHLTINKSDVWDYRVPRGESCLVQAGLDEVRHWVAGQDKPALSGLSEACAQRSARAFPTLQPCAEARLELCSGSQSWDYEERLCMATAELQCRYRSFGGRSPGGLPVTETSFVSAVRPVFVLQVRLESRRPCGHRVSLVRNENPFLPEPCAGAGEDVIWLVARFPDGLLSLTAVAFRGVYVQTEAGTGSAVARLRSGGPDAEAFAAMRETFQGTRGELDPPGETGGLEFEVFLTTVRGRDEAALLEEARRNLRDAREAGFDALRSEHRLWWREFWSRAYLELDRPAAEQMWYLGLYLLGSGSRRGCQAAGLQAIWGNQNVPPWCSDYHNDINVQANYWSVYASDHLEQAEPFYRLYEHMAMQARRDTAAWYGSRGLKFPMAGGPDGHELGGYPTCTLWAGGTAWLLLHFWWQYRYTLDRDWLREHAWPLFVDAAQFYEDYLLPDGKGGWKVFPSYSPEEVGDTPESLGTNSTCDLALMRAFLRAAVEAARVLRDGSNRAQRWKSILDALPDYPTIADPWSLPGVDSTRFKDLEERDFDFQVAHLPLTLSPVYPAGEITAWSAEAPRRKALATLERLKERTRRQVMGGFAGEYVGYVQARLGLPNALDDLDKVAARHLRPGGRQAFTGFFGKPGSARRFMQVDWILGYPGPLMECLLQSHDGVIRAFPAVPREFSGRFEGFRAEGGFRVAGEMEDGAVTEMEIECLVSGTCRIACPWEAADLTLNGEPLTDFRCSPLAVPLRVGDRLALRPSPCPADGVRAGCGPSKL